MSRPNRIPLANAVSLVAWGQDFSQEKFAAAAGVDYYEREIEEQQDIIKKADGRIKAENDLEKKTDRQTNREKRASGIELLRGAVEHGKEAQDRIVAIGTTYPSDEAKEQLAAAFAKIVAVCEEGAVAAYGNGGPIPREYFERDPAPVADVITGRITREGSTFVYEEVSFLRRGIEALAARAQQTAEDPMPKPPEPDPVPKDWYDQVVFWFVNVFIPEHKDDKPNPAWEKSWAEAAKQFPDWPITREVWRDQIWREHRPKPWGKKGPKPKT